jgi:hypothetical protein
MAQLKKIWNNHSKTGADFFMLLLPGALSSLLIFLISSNRLFPASKDYTLSLLNFYQIQMLGITIAKYGIDQMVISRLKPGHRTTTNSFFLQRVFPLTLLFCLVIGFIKGWMYSAFLALILPMEVMSILISVEWSVSNRIKFTSLLTFLGNPLAFILAYTAYKHNLLSLNLMLACFLSSSLIRIIIALIFRNKGDKTAIAILSYHVPLQQVGNYFMFRLDQLIIAMSLGIYFFANKPLITHYLFLAKFPEVASGVIVSLAPIIYRQLGDRTNASLKKLFKNKFFLLLSIGICSCQLIVLLLFKNPGMSGNTLLFFPFVLSSLLILPANLVTYVLLKNAEVPKINLLNLISIVAGLLIFGLVLLCNNIYIFSLIVPIQLLVYIIFFQVLYYKQSDKENAHTR